MNSYDKYSRTRVDRYFLPYELSPKIILNVIRSEQRNLSPDKYNPTTMEKITEQTRKLDLLRIHGRQLPTSTPKPPIQSRIRSKTRDGHLRRIKHILNEPLKQHIQQIARDPDLVQFQKSGNESPIRLPIRIAKQYSEGNTPMTENNIEQYEQMILNNPMLYNKIIGTYKSTRRKTQMKKSIPRDTQKFTRKQQLSSKDLQQTKRLASITQYRQFLLAINASNCQIVIPSVDACYKAFVGRGNNGVLVKSIIKTRPWWGFKPYSESDSCNIIWTEWKKTKVTNSLAEKAKLNIENVATDSIGGLFAASIVNEKFKKKQEQLQKLIKIQNFVSSPDILFGPQASHQYFAFTKRHIQKKYQQLAQNHLKNIQTVININKKDVVKIVNHLPGCLHLHSKKLLFVNMRRHYNKIKKDLNDVLPETYLVAEGVENSDFMKFIQNWQQTVKRKQKGRNVWICKPGQNSNRGNGIEVMNTLSEIRNYVKAGTTGNRSVIIQKYIENPMLYNKRKFDIRCFILITTVNGIVKGYWYDDSYIRTASKQYNLKSLDNRMIHLTNDAVQKKGQNYGKFQNHNKITLTEFQRYIETTYGQSIDWKESYAKMREITTEMINSVAHKVNPQRKQYSFELFGLDYMLDEKGNPYLIEANSNPCIEAEGAVLGKIIPSLIQNVIRIAIDPLFPPPFADAVKMGKLQMGNPFQQNKFQLVYDSLFEPINPLGSEQDIKNDPGEGEMELQFDEDELNQQTMN